TGEPRRAWDVRAERRYCFGVYLRLAFAREGKPAATQPQSVPRLEGEHVSKAKPSALLCITRAARGRQRAGAEAPFSAVLRPRFHLEVSSPTPWLRPEGASFSPSVPALVAGGGKQERTRANPRVG